MNNKERYADDVYAFIQKKRFFKILQANLEYIDCTIQHLRKMREKFLKKVFLNHYFDRNIYIN